MSLRHALLGFLSTTPASGYALGRKFSDGAGAMWEALPSQIYPELKRLEELGWIEGDVDESDQLKRKVYKVTTAGRTALQEWVESDEAEHPPQKDAELVRFLFLDRSDFSLIRRHAVRHREHYAARLAQWTTERDSIAAGTHERAIDRLAQEPDEQRGFVLGMKWFAFQGLVKRAQMEIDWAEEVLGWLGGLHESKSDCPLPKDAEATARKGRPKG
jgi:PadR family transcriptional regulator AphA